MQLHELKPTHKRKKIKRIARGGKRGTTSGRGQKGQKSRSGHKIRPAERDTILKFPKLRGQKKPAFGKNRERVINIGDIQNNLDGAINKKVLLEAKIIKSLDENFKILGKGRVVKNFQVEGIKISKKAKEKIEKAGGSVK